MTDVSMIVSLVRHNTRGVSAEELRLTKLGSVMVPCCGDHADTCRQGEQAWTRFATRQL